MWNVPSKRVVIHRACGEVLLSVTGKPSGTNKENFMDENWAESFLHEQEAIWVTQTVVGVSVSVLVPHTDTCYLYIYVTLEGETLGAQNAWMGKISRNLLSERILCFVAVFSKAHMWADGDAHTHM